MIRFSKIFLALTVAVLLLWQLPWCYTFFAAKASKPVFTLYSSELGEFVSMGNADGRGVKYCDESGNFYTREQADSLLPFFYMRQLMADERFPDTINGVPLTPREVQQANFNFRCTASDVNAVTIPLYPLLESMSGRVELQMPDDVFRLIDDGIEFIDIKSNAVDADKSRLFTEAMRKKGFEFPVRHLAGNPTTRKEYDEGYLALDRNGHLFHLKMTCGRPYVRAIALPEGLEVKRIFVTEFRDRKTLGFLCTADGSLYVLNNKTYEVLKSGVASYRPEEDAITVYGNLLDWTVCVRTAEATHYYALDAQDYSLLRAYSVALEGGSVPGLHFTSSSDKYVRPRF